MTASLLGLGTAVPIGSVTQEDAAELVCSFNAENGRRSAVLALFRRAGIARRGSVLADDDGCQRFYEPDAGCGPTVVARMAAFAEHAGALAAQACSAALAEAEVSPQAITHLITVSCTGLAAPGVDLALIEMLQLPHDVARTNIGFMGCHAAVNALRVAKALAEADAGARVLVCCIELCTLHLSAAETIDAHVANALFADGSAAAVVAQSDRSPAIRDTASILIPGTSDLMSWSIGPNSFRMTLSPRVPDVLSEHVPPWIDRWLGDTARIGSWAIHPGGPRVLSTLARALGLPDDATEASRDILRNHGNMSSATLLFILDRLLHEQGGTPAIGIAFGPGLAGEAILIE